MMNTERTELLAPAGNLACALAAFDAGADAVYAGLKRFNARERTENFSAEDMSKLIACAGKQGKKVYITFNTLIKENEICDAAEELAQLELLRPDAVIVQDLGVLRLLRDYFPGLTIHASTQMGLHNSAGMRFAKELGVSRVILERQTTLNEIKKMHATAPDVELEMFIHGALCCCISGTCLLSSWLGGWSGNRGKCKQPCRRRYHSENGNGFFLSAQDLCTLELIPDIMTSGVKSLKIEGRLRRADYVENVVAAYRMAMDAANDPETFRAVLPQAKERLAKTCGRKWSLGFYTEQSRKELIKFDALGASGQLCGKVLSVEKNGFTVLPSRRIHLGDVIRVQPRSGDEGPAVTITRMSRNGKPVSRALKDEAVLIHSDKMPAKDALVYKTGESTGDYTRRIEMLPLRKTVLDFDVFLNRKEIRIAAAGDVWCMELDLAAAGTRPLQPEMLRNELKHAGTEQLEAGKIQVEIAENPFLPASVLKGIRKAYSAWLAENLDEADVKRDNRERLDRFLTHYRSRRNGMNCGEVRHSAIVPRGRKISSPGTVIIREIKDEPSPHEELLLPFFVRENDLPAVENAIAAYYRKGGRTVRITSLHHFALLKQYPDMKIHTCMPLPVCNSMTVEELERLGVTLAQAWLELGKNELESLAEKACLPMELYRSGRPVLLATHAKIPAEGKLSDARGNEFLLNRQGNLTLLTAVKPMQLPMLKNFSAELADLRYTDNGKAEKQTAIFNFDCGLS